MRRSPISSTQKAHKRTRIANGLVDYSGRLFRTGKAVISAELANIFDRLGTSADSCWSALKNSAKGAC
jgi:hypothetical protein